MHKAADWLCRYYNTNVLGFYFANKLAIFANDAESVKEALLNQDMDGKPSMLLAKVRDPNLNQRGVHSFWNAYIHDKLCIYIYFNFKGIFFIDGPFWKQQRRFTLRHMRDYGFGRRFEQLECETKEELLQMIDIIKNGAKFKHEKVIRFSVFFLVISADTWILNIGLLQKRKGFIAASIYGSIWQFLLQSSVQWTSFKSRSTTNLRVNIYDDNYQKKMFTCYTILRFRFGEQNLNFQKNACLWGRMFSVVESFGKLFPELTGYRKIKETTAYHYSFMTVSKI